MLVRASDFCRVFERLVPQLPRGGQQGIIVPPNQRERPAERPAAVTDFGNRQAHLDRQGVADENGRGQPRRNVRVRRSDANITRPDPSRRGHPRSCRSALRGLPCVALGIGFVLFFPGLPQPIRIVDGILIGIGAIGLAWRIWTSDAERSEMIAASAARPSG